MTTLKLGSTMRTVPIALRMTDDEARRVIDAIDACPSDLDYEVLLAALIERLPDVDWVRIMSETADLHIK